MRLRLQGATPLPFGPYDETQSFLCFLWLRTQSMLCGSLVKTQAVLKTPRLFDLHSGAPTATDPLLSQSQNANNSLLFITAPAKPPATATATATACPLAGVAAAPPEPPLSGAQRQAASGGASDTTSCGSCCAY